MSLQAPERHHRTCTAELTHEPLPTIDFPFVFPKPAVPRDSRPLLLCLATSLKPRERPMTR